MKAESTALTELIHSAKNADKLIMLKVFKSELTAFPSDSGSFARRFVEAALYASNPSDLAIINEYKVESYPSIILLNSSGQLILPVKKVDNPAEMEEYAEMASKMKHDPKPLAQCDLDYRNNKMDKTSLYEYIGKRTSLGLDNSEIIDTYAESATASELLDKASLLLFLDKNSFNIPGAYCNFMTQNQETIKQILKLSDERFNRLVEKSVEYSFRKICSGKDEAALNHIIDMKVHTLNAGDGEVLYNEYMTRYFHATYQPLKLAHQAQAYVDAIFKHREQRKKALAEQNKKLFAPFANSAEYPACALKLRNAAQYVVEILSAKSILNDALSWSIAAEHHAGDNDRYYIYETQSYILYKLGKRDEAVANMEKAYHAIPQDDIEQRKAIGFNLIKMKRGEKIY
jgi:hypothetical protein